MILITQIIHAHSPTGGKAEKSKMGKKRKLKSPVIPETNTTL